MKFELDEVEEKAAKEFTNKHSKICASYNSHGFPIGTLFNYIFTPTGIGIGVSIQCNSCKEEANITNYDNW